MFGSYKVKLEGELLEKIQKCVEAGSYESVDQFVIRVLERELDKVLPPDQGNAASKDLVKKHLQGLGYIE
jgi:Arc/MetJ-type ribon-helix-helix transcriptional regulator